MRAVGASLPPRCAPVWTTAAAQRNTPSSEAKTPQPLTAWMLRDSDLSRFPLRNSILANIVFKLQFKLFCQDRRADVDEPFVHPPCPGRQMIGAEQRSLAWRLAIDEPLQSLSVEHLNPVADDLRRHAAEPGHLRPARSLTYSRDRQKPARLRALFGAPRRRTAAFRVKIIPQGQSSYSELLRSPP